MSLFQTIGSLISLAAFFSYVNHRYLRLPQTIGVMVLRQRDPDLPRPFRMWLYPVPAVLAFLGFIYVIVMRPKSLESIRLAVVVIIVGTVLFWIRRRRRLASYQSE